MEPNIRVLEEHFPSKEPPVRFHVNWWDGTLVLFETKRNTTQFGGTPPCFHAPVSPEGVLLTHVWFRATPLFPKCPRSHVRLRGETM